MLFRSLHFHVSLSCIGEGNGNPFQYSCLENPRDGGAWWDAGYGVVQSRTRLKRLSSTAEPSGMHLLPMDTRICWMSGMLAPLWPMPAFLVYPLRSLTPPPKAGPHHKCSPASHSPRVISSTLKVSTLTCTPKFTSNLVSLRNLSP